LLTILNINNLAHTKIKYHGWLSITYEINLSRAFFVLFFFISNKL